jgi:hypothetical protein
MFNMATRMYNMMHSTNEGDKEKWQKVLDRWQWTFGGNPKQLISTVEKGGKKKAIRNKKDIPPGELQKTSIKSAGADGYYSVSGWDDVAYITLASSVIAAITPLISGGAGKDEVGGEGYNAMREVAKQQAIDQINKSKLPDDTKAELIARLNAGENPEDVNYDALDESLPGGLPEWAWWAIGGSVFVLVAGIGFAIYKKSQKSKKQ